MEIKVINLAIVSDIRLYREGLGRILSETDEINVVGVIESHEEIFKLLEFNQLDIMLLDMRMVNNYDILTAIIKDYADTKIIVLAVPENDENYLLCVESGIAGYLAKESTIDDLVDAVKTVDKGNLYCPCVITQYILKSVKNIQKSHQINDIKFTYSKLLELLTQREFQIIKLLAEGNSNKQIANILTIELSTVKNHVHNILVKMGVDSRTRAVSLLQENDLIHQSRSLDLDPQI
jgi:DNA-binding NarL/FixJ family response regulator